MQRVDLGLGKVRVVKRDGRNAEPFAGACGAPTDLIRIAALDDVRPFRIEDAFDLSAGAAAHDSP